MLRMHLTTILRELVHKPLPKGEAWNVNFPNCPVSEYRGILYDRKPAQTPFFDDVYYRQARGDGGNDIMLRAEELQYAEEGSDIRALIDNCISVGIIRNSAMC